MAVSSIKFKISADIKELKTAMNEASKSVQDTASKAKASGGMLSSIANGFKSIGSSAMNAMKYITRMAAGITIFKAINSTMHTLGESVQKAFTRMDAMQNFDRAMTRITGSSEDAKKALAEVNKIVLDTPYGLDTAARAVQGFANSNMGVANSIKYVKGWGDAVAAYGDGSNETLQRVTFQLNQMASKGKVSLEELNVAMEAGIPALQIYADATGQSVQEVRDQISDGKISAVDFMETMNNAFENGTASFASISGEAKKAGSTWQGTFDNMKAATARGMEAVIKAIDEGLVKVGLPTIKEAIKMYGDTLENGMKDLGGKVAPAIKSISDTFEKFKPVIEAVGKALTGLAESAGGKLLEAFGEIGTQTGSVFETLANFITKNMPTIEKGISTTIEVVTGIFLGLGDTIKELMPAFQTLMDIFKGVMEGIQGMIPEGKNLQDIVREWTPIILKAYLAFKSLQLGVGIAKGAFSGFTKVLDGVGKFKTFISAVGGGTRAFNQLGTVGKVIATAFKVLGTVFTTVGGVIMTAIKGIGALIVANPIVATILAIIAIITVLWLKCEWFRDGVIAVWEAIKKAFSAAVKAISGFIDDLIKFFGKVGTEIGKVASDIGKWFSDVLKSIGKFLSDIGNAIATGFKFVVNVITVIFMTIYSVISGVITIILSVIKVFLDSVRYAWEIAWKVISDFFKGIWNGIVEFLTPIVEGIVTFLSNRWENIKDTVRVAWMYISEFLIDIWESIKAVVITVWTAISDFFKAVWDGIVAFLTPVVNGIATFISNTWDTIKSVTETAWNAISSFFSDVWNAIVTTVTNFINAVAATVGNVWNDIKVTTSNIWEGIKSYLSGIWEGIKTTVDSAIKAVQTTVSSIWDAIKTTTENAWNAVKEAITKPINAAKDVIEDVLDGIKGFFDNLKIKFPDIEPPKLPHFSLNGSFSLDPPSVPSLSVDWYATGGIATGASVVGIGEAGDEAIVPLSNKSRMKPFASAISSMIKDDASGDSNNNGAGGVLISGNTFIVRQESDIRKIGQELVKEADRRDSAVGKRKWAD